MRWRLPGWSPGGNVKTSYSSAKQTQGPPHLLSLRLGFASSRKYPWPGSTTCLHTAVDGELLKTRRGSRHLLGHPSFRTQRTGVRVGHATSAFPRPRCQFQGSTSPDVVEIVRSVMQGTHRIQVALPLRGLCSSLHGRRRQADTAGRAADPHPAEPAPSAPSHTATGCDTGFRRACRNPIPTFLFYP